MHRVLSIPEILLYIFSCLSTADNASNVRVCKLWSHLALNIVWYSVEDVAGIFQSITEMYVNEEGELVSPFRSLNLPVINIQFGLAYSGVPTNTYRKGLEFFPE